MNQPGKSLHCDGRWLRDRRGRVVLLRGINCGGDSKIPPFQPFSTEQSAAQIAAWGLNCVRYCAVWEGIEAEEGRFHDGYLDAMEERVAWLTARGLYVFIDMHQDLFSRRYHGSGAPAWVAPPCDPSRLPQPKGGPRWFLNYPSDPVCDAFDRFWSEAHLQDHFLEALRRIAERFARNERVIGYDILNEPWHGHGDVFSGAFEQSVLAPFYRRAIELVRSADPNALLFFEPALAMTAVVGTQSRLPHLGHRGLVYAPHYYPIGALTGEEADIEGALRDADIQLARYEEKASELEVPTLLGEFGMHPRQHDGLRFLHGYYDLLDKHRIGGTVWNYAQRDREWNDESMSFVGPHLEERPYVEALVRPYAMATAGTPRSMRWDPTTRRFRLEVDGPPIDAETLVRLPSRLYPHGVEVEASAGRVIVEPEHNLLRWDAGGAWEPRALELAPR